MASIYKYNRIDLATDAIRLVRLRRGCQEQPIECEIFETYLHQAEGVPYEALSYVWGTRQSKDWIWVHGCRFQVTENLYEALVNLRRPGEDRVLWIDAICIDQSHNAERGHQVGQMRHVYRNAQRVIVWLGASNLLIDILFDWTTDLDKQVLAIAHPHTISTWENQWFDVVHKQRMLPPPVQIGEELSRLLRREWFSRVWVLQEAALAKSAMITCGQKEVNSRAFIVMPSLLDIGCSKGEQSRLDILPGLLRGRSWWAEDSSRDLSTLLQKFRSSKAGNHRDIIYALLGLSEDAHSSQLLRPNYDISLQETIQQCVAYLMMRTHDLPSHTPIHILPVWSLSDFLNCLYDLPLKVFQWATDNAQDVLLHNILLCQSEKHDIQHIQAYMSCAGRHGPPITIAMKKENSALIELLLQFRDTDIETKDWDGNTPLSIAVGQGNMVVADSILERMTRNAHTRDSRGNTPLLVAATQGVSVFKALLLKYPELDTYSRYVSGDTRLLTAIKHGDSNKVKLILNSSEAEMHIADCNGDGPLNIAARRGDETIVDLLLEKIDLKHITFRGSDGLTPLESALVGGFSRIVQKLLGYPRVHPVYGAANANQFDFLRRILDAAPLLANADLFPIPTPLGTAAAAGCTSCVRLLLDMGAKINAGYSDGQPATPLWIAASRGHLDTVKILVKGGASIESTARDVLIEITPVWAAAFKGHFDVVKYFLKIGAKVQVRAKDHLLPLLRERQGGTAFLNAAISVGHRKAIEILVEGGVDIEKSCRWITDPENIESKLVGQQTWAKPLWIAASLGHTNIVRLLIQHKADIEARDSYYGLTPFQRAAQQKRSGVMTVLTEAGADTRPTK